MLHEREVTDDVSILDRLVSPAGKDVIDIGCGGGGLVRALADAGARVLGVETSDEKLVAARTRNAGRDRVRYVVGRAQALPVDDASADVAVFMRTLHHVPRKELLNALREARRVLRPGGVVYVAEPLAEGDFFALTSLVEDEREVRQAAQHALDEAFLAGLERVTTLEYELRSCVGSLGALRARLVSVDPDRGRAFDARKARIAEAFARLGEPGERPGERCFAHPMRVELLRATAS